MVKWYQGEDVDEPNLEGQSVRVWLLLNSLSIRHHAHVGFPLVGNSTREYLVEVSRQEAWKYGGRAFGGGAAPGAASSTQRRPT